MASSIDNFATAVFMEWQDKLDIYGNVWDTNPTGGVVCAERGIQLFLKESFPEPLYPRRDGVRNVDEISQTVRVRVAELDVATQQVLAKSYVRYRSKFEKQDAMLRTGGFLKVFAESFAALPECTTHSLTLYDRDLHTNRPSWGVEVDLDNPKLRQDALVSILSRPMLWEDARWAGTRDDVWCHVPVEMLIDVLLEIGKHDGAIIDYLSINLTAAPDYALMKSDVHRLRELTEAVRSLDLFQFRFKADRPGWFRLSSQRAMRSPNEMKALNDYFGAIVAAKTLASFEVDLGDFWESAGLGGTADATAPLGARFDWSFGPEFRSISLYAACMTIRDFERLAKWLPEDVDVGLDHVYLLE
ncbi:hypothetical protein CkaCkLH20_04623 [Colletotrichum karsti]|uniref:Uncharacterized protein n=1 Tax=Colletotrichum karsti TaxID=1095194 RepID=A0A9P6I958_9PEZI|nr:uncharacterized protein CkaCkLH20_04623 [Colletotrichum karsti]KAF9878047.1 hypothetical protein CkaCkLH20_04623 [Colletotrichum karsti]